MVPKRASIAPGKLLTLYPIKVEQFTAKAPGKDWDITSISKKSSLDIQEFFIYNLFLYKWNHCIASTKGKGTYFKETPKHF